MNRIGRMEEKRALKKRRRYVTIALMLLFFLLVSGLLATDYALRDMMALFDGSQLFAYSREINTHHFELMGQEFFIDQELIYVNFMNYIEWTRGKSKELFESIKGLVGKMSG